MLVKDPLGLELGTAVRVELTLDDDGGPLVVTGTIVREGGRRREGRPHRRDLARRPGPPDALHHRAPAGRAADREGRLRWRRRPRSRARPPEADGGKVAVIAHPRARTSIRRWRGRAGLIALVVVTLLSLRAGVPAFDAVLRGLAGGDRRPVRRVGRRRRHLAPPRDRRDRRAPRRAAQAHRRAPRGRRGAQRLAAVAVDPIRPIGPRPDLAPAERVQLSRVRARRGAPRARGAPPPAPASTPEPPAARRRRGPRHPRLRTDVGVGEKFAQVLFWACRSLRLQEGVTRSRSGPRNHTIIKER